MKVIRGGLIVDGLGTPAFCGDVLVEGDRIVDVVRGESRAEGETIDAAGAMVTPGFIDAHAHSDAYLVIEPDAPSKISQGVTTEINGQCGGSIAPRYGEARLSGDWAALLGDRLTWRSLGEYREVLEQVKIAVNTVEFVGHNTLRSSVVGYAGRAASGDELGEMKRLLSAALDEGGWGLTTGLVYQPGKYSTPEEVMELAAVTAAKGGFYATHMRSEGDAILEAMDEVIELVRKTGIRAEISHLKTSGERNWGKIDAVLEKLDLAVGRGELLGSDRYPFTAAGTDLDIVLPDWAQEGAALSEMRRLADSALRSRIVAEIDAQDRDWSKVMVGGTWHERTKPCSGMTVRQVLEDESLRAELQVSTPGELVARILELDGCKTGVFFFSMSEENLAKIYSRPYVLPGSDASLRAPWGPLGADFPHPRAYATMPEYYRRVRALGFTREETIARMTSAVADRFGIAGRGRIAKGAFADLVVLDENDFRCRATFADPHRFSSGVRLVMVNGSVPYASGKFSGIRSGRFLSR